MKSDLKTNILTISDRVNRGGAAVISKKIHEYATKKNEFETVFLYGWDDNGLPNSSYPKNITSVSYLLGPHINALTCRIVGRNLFPSKKKKLKAYIDWSDVIHIHNVHTYGFEYEQLFSLIIKSKKKVIITAHDDWYYTGRCAFRENCEIWQEGCPKCPHLDYYHPTIFDNAGKEYLKKVALLNEIEDCTFVAPSNHIADALSKVYTNKKIKVISNGIITSNFNPPQYLSEDENLSVLVVTNNFEDSNKIDFNFMNRLVAANINLHLVGEKSSYKGPNVTNHGYVKKQERLGEIMQNTDVMVFFSKVDSFGLILAEALCTGIHICAYDSRAAREVLDGFDKSIISEDPEAFLKLIKQPAFITRLRNLDLRKTQGQLAKERFDQVHMLEGYVQLYTPRA